MPEPINDNNQPTNGNSEVSQPTNDNSEFLRPIDDNISNEDFKLSENILQALLKIIYALNGGPETVPVEIRNIIKGDNDDLNDDPRLSFNIIKALDAIAGSIYLKQQSSTDEEQTGTQVQV